MNIQEKILQNCRNAEVNLVFAQGINPDFKTLCRQLDLALDQAIGGHEKRRKFVPFNKEDTMDVVVLAYAQTNTRPINSPVPAGSLPIGCGAYRIYDKAAIEIKRVFVADTFRRKGIAASTLLELLAHGKSQGFQRAILETGAFLEASVKLYESLGFYKIPNYPPYEDIPESMCMEISL